MSLVSALLVGFRAFIGPFLRFSAMGLLVFTAVLFSIVVRPP